LEGILYFCTHAFLFTCFNYFAMNYICLSPYFPPNYYPFSVALNQHGVNVFGLGDAPFEFLQPELKSALTEYYRVDDLHNYDQLMRALGYFTHRYGRIDGIDSHNEYWLETEAQLRLDFNMEGLKPADMSRVRRKSEMKKVFLQEGLNVARGILSENCEKVKIFAGKTGFPLIVKPDSGVGATNTYKIDDEKALDEFLNKHHREQFLVEEFIDGEIFSYDGLTDKSGNLVFSTALKNEKGVMEVVNEDSHVYYYSLIDIPHDLEEAGKKLLKAFDVKGRFFHLEFFRENVTCRLVALEVNIRPPGGFTTEMFNYATDANVYDAWAAMIAGDPVEYDFSRKYHVCFVSRKLKYDYHFSHQELMDEFQDKIVFHQKVEDALSRAMGNYCYLLRSADLSTIFAVQKAIHKLKIA
jgi:predicted ATP-grasp superfamily ATP-dependent carboligase